MIHSDLWMVIFFWISLFIAVAIYAYSFKIKKKDILVLKKQMLFSVPFWLFLVYQSYYTLKQVQMSGMERWAVIPFVLGLGYYMAILKLSFEKKETK